VSLFRLIVLFVLAFVIIVLAVSNTAPVEVSIPLLTTFELPLFLVFFISIILGLLAGASYHYTQAFAHKREVRKLKKRIDELAREQDKPTPAALHDSESDTHIAVR
jgi:uncharacterized integral membrane protein